MPYGAAALFVALLVWAPPATAQEADGADCSTCHDHGQKLKESAHAAVACLKCHPKHEEYPHPADVPKTPCSQCHGSEAKDYALGAHGRAAKAGNAAAPDCALCHGGAHETTRASTEAFRRSIPETCGMCHDTIAAEFNASVHGAAVRRGVTASPVCSDCHGEHSIIPVKERASPVSPAHVSETCARCHGDVRLTRRFGLPPDRVTSFESSFHGLAARAGSQSVANCASCHGVHSILPSSDPKSMIHPARLPETCGKCHPGAGMRFAIGQIHIVAGREEPRPVYWARWFYLSLIPLTIGLMLLHHGGDWIRKLFALRLCPAPAPPPRPLAGKPEMRMLPWERVQHALLAISFIVLVWTGFALRYPEQFWARPLVMWESNWPVRGTVHRIAAVVLMAVSMVHAITLLASRRLRTHWLTLLPRKRDLYEGFAGLAWAIGLRRSKPVISAHSYIEKVEYWAVIWGTFIMALTGVLLWANNWTLRYLPKSVLDLASTIHFYEAILAALSIAIWHFYSVIFDPDVYPMDPAWLTGISVRRRDSHEPKAPPTPMPQPETEEAPTPNEPEASAAG